MPLHLPVPDYIQFYPTTRCNQKCSFCFNSGIAKEKDITYTSALRLADILVDRGIRDLDIMGGEPLLLDWMPDFVVSASRRGLGVNISTNGSRTGLMERFSAVDPGRVNIGVSLEGGTKKNHNALINSDNFEQALISIRKLVMMGLDPIVKTVLNKTTMTDIQNIVNVLKDLGVRRYYLIHMDVMAKDSPLLREALSYADFDEFYGTVKKANPDMGIFSVHASCFSREKLPAGARCAAGVLKVSVMPDGSVYPCTLFNSIEEFELGNIFDDDLSSILTNPKLTFFRSFRSNRCEIEGCKNRASCTGGCPAHGYYHYRRLDAPDIRCTAAIQDVLRR